MKKSSFYDGLDDMPERSPNRYRQLIEKVFFDSYQDGLHEVAFTRRQLVDNAQTLNIRLPSNIGDVLYSFRYRADLPTSILDKAPQDQTWIIMPAGRGRYKFVASVLSTIMPTEGLAETKIPDATPGIIVLHKMNDEQALLAKVRYNRLIDIFTGVTCYSLQSHLRTTVVEMGQVETDELYIGVDRRGAQYVFPVQAKGGTDRLSIVQILQDVQVGAQKFPQLICRPIAAQFIEDDLIALFDFEVTDAGIALLGEKHFRLVPPDEVTVDDLNAYRLRPMD